MTENNKCAHGFTTGLSYLLIGGGIGATLALLFAPKSGSDLRGNIADVTRKGYDATVEKTSAWKDQSADVIQTVKDKAEAAYDFAAGKFNQGSEAVSDVANAVGDGIERMQNESGLASKANGRKSADIV